MLEWVSIYWFSRAGPAASLRIYKEMTGSRSYDSILGVKAPVPFGYSAFPKELIQSPRLCVTTDIFLLGLRLLTFFASDGCTLWATSSSSASTSMGAISRRTSSLKPY